MCGKKVCEGQEMGLSGRRRRVFYTLHGKRLRPWLRADVAESMGLSSDIYPWLIVQREPMSPAEETTIIHNGHT